MSRYFIEDVKCGYDTCFDCCGPHTTVASAIKYKNDDGKQDGCIAYNWKAMIR